ncbi:hypothetical protein FRC04_003272 [Tulasnella sp. 424]|nr:hypothetical protein FRC04_003272 [Tulasnella sp. 424]
MDLGPVLAKFTVPGPIKTRADLDATLSELLATITVSRDDITSLLSALKGCTQGLMEAILTARDHDAFTFRERILKAARKPSAASIPIFRTCADRLGVFLASVPPDVPLDHTVMQSYNLLATTIVTPNSPEPDRTANHKPRPVSPTSPKSGKKKRVLAVMSLAPQGPSLSVGAKPTSPTASSSSLGHNDSRSGSASDVSPLILRFFENFFSACLEEEIEEFALETLFGTLTQDSAPPLSSPLQEKSARLVSAPPQIDDAPAGAVTKSTTIPKTLHYLSLRPDDIAQYLNAATQPKFGDWPVVVSQRGIKHLRDYVASKKDIFLMIEKKIKQLSVGFFSPANQTELLERDFGIPIYTADVGGGLRLIYHIDFGAPVGHDQESQFIRVFGVFSDSETDMKFWRSVAAELARRGPEYIERCNERAAIRVRSKGIQTIPPRLLPPLDVSQWHHRGADVQIDESHFLELHRILALEKFVPLSQQFFEVIQKFDEKNFMFAVSSSEYQIIKHPSSCLVLGRSGTGKTTCMLFRMIGLDIAAQKFGRSLRQVFVTRSRTLARSVRQYYAQLKRTETNESGSLREETTAGLSLLEMDENAEVQGALPSKFSELQDSHFPLFLTYDQLCKLLEADYGLQFIPNSINALTSLRLKRDHKSARQPFVSFEYFESNVWPRLDRRLKKGLHPTIVYSEFMGVIKGSEASFNGPRQYLDRETYESQSSRTHSGDQTERSRIYTLFEGYLKIRPLAAYDIADKVGILMREIDVHGVPGTGFDFLYVDEAQDHLIMDAALLRSLCPNPHGLFFAGDTAQTISAGSTFRFSELRALLYRLEREDSYVRRGSRKAVDPRFFQLSTNYRSHSGIVNVAAFIVKLIDSYFQYSIDTLMPEVSLVDVSAHKPVFFSGREDQSDFLRLTSTHTSDTDKVELGAHQVIIVRDDAAASRLQAIVGKVAVVLTLYESKGMEFDDSMKVLLYDFFTDSPATATDWRALRNAQRNGGTFDERRHSIIQTELKSLYVGLTRARERVWIWDRSRKGSNFEASWIISPLALLVGLHLASAFSSTEAVPQLGTSSTPDEWAQRAQQYFSKRLFPEAALCFRNANMEWWASVALAYDHRQVAIQLSEHHQGRRSALANVAQEFENLAQSPHRTGDSTTCLHLFLNAGECYGAIPSYMASANSFLKAERYTEAAFQYRMAGSFEEATGIVKRYPVDPEVRESVIYAAKVVYIRQGDVESLHKAWHLCESKAEFLDFLEDQGFQEHKIVFLDSIDAFEESGQILWSFGDYASAISRFCQAKTGSSRQKAAECLLDGLRTNISLEVSYGRPSELVSQLFSLGDNVELLEREQAELGLLRAVVQNESEELKAHGRRAFDGGDIGGALLALDAWAQSGALQALESTSEANVAEILALCEMFGRAVKALIQTPLLLDHPPIQSLLGIACSHRNSHIQIRKEITVYPHSIIYSLAQLPTASSGTRGMAPTVRPRSTVVPLIRDALLRRLSRVVNTVESQARESRVFEPCYQSIATGLCQDTRCRSLRDHPKPTEWTIHEFNSRFRLHILMIALLDQAPRVGHSGEKNRSARQTLWLTRLFKLCYPPNPKLGSLSDIIPALIPEYTTAMPVVDSWLKEVFQSQRPSNEPQFFLTNILMTSLLATGFNRRFAASYLWDGQWAEDQTIAAQAGLMNPSNNRPLVGNALLWVAPRHPTPCSSSARYAITGQASLDVNVAIAFAEEVCGQLILNNYAHLHDRYHGMTMPRSWIIRAFFRAASGTYNGSMPWRMMATLSKLIDGLLFKIDPGGRHLPSLLKHVSDILAGKLHVDGTGLRDVKAGYRSYSVGKLCRCLALIGLNSSNDKLCGQIVAMLRRIGEVPYSGPWLDVRRYATVLKWADVVVALTATQTISDELVTILQKEGRTIGIPGVRTIFCPDESKIVEQLLLTPDLPALVAPINHVIDPGNPTSPESAPSKDTREARPKQGNRPTNESSRDERDLQKSATTIQAFFRRHKPRAGGKITADFEDVVRFQIRSPERCAPARSWLLCLRGPLPHVIEFLHKTADLAQSSIDLLNEEMHSSNHEALDELHAKGAELRGVRNDIAKLINELQPSSDFYSRDSAGTPDSVLEIVDRVKAIPNIVKNLQKFTSCPKDIDYELGIEPLVCDRGPWRVPNSGAE